MPDAPSIPGSDLDLADPAVVADVLLRAAALNLQSPLREGSTIHLPEQGVLWFPGDIHDNGLNFLRILKLAQLQRHPQHHVVFHELCHGPNLVNGCDFSIRLVTRIAALKCQYPDQVHLLLANHDLAQALGNEILKDGHGVVAAFNAGLDYLFSDEAPKVAAAFREFVFSFNLAIRHPRGIICTHSLPSPYQLPKFDRTVLERVPTEQDLMPGGSAYMLVWGRRHTFDLEEELATAWNVQTFIMGHQPAEMGYDIEGNTILILASDHDHGVVLPMDLSKTYDRDQLVGELLPLAGVIL